MCDVRNGVVDKTLATQCKRRCLFHDTTEQGCTQKGTQEKPGQPATLEHRTEK